MADDEEAPQKPRRGIDTGLHHSFFRGRIVVGECGAVRTSGRAFSNACLYEEMMNALWTRCSKPLMWLCGAGPDWKYCAVSTFLVAAPSGDSPAPPPRTSKHDLSACDRPCASAVESEEAEAEQVAC